MSRYKYSDPALEDRALSERSLTFELNIDTSDCPETYLVDIDDEIVIVRAEGATATADAVEDIACDDNAFTAPSDANGIVGFLLQKSKFEPDQTIDRVRSVEVVYQSSSTSAVALVGDNRSTNSVSFASGVTADGNIAFEIDSAANFATTDYRVIIKVSYSTRP